VVVEEIVPKKKKKRNGKQTVSMIYSPRMYAAHIYISDYINPNVR
jgi:hypothetical protein